MRHRVRRRNVPSSVAIIGGGGAGNSAAEELRHLGFESPITLVDPDEHAPCDRHNPSSSSAPSCLPVPARWPGTGPAIAGLRWVGYEAPLGMPLLGFVIGAGAFFAPCALQARWDDEVRGDVMLTYGTVVDGTHRLRAMLPVIQERVVEWRWDMHPMWWMWGAGGLVMMLMMLVFWAVVIAGLVLGIRWLLSEGRTPTHDSALTILRDRYARGEINREEFEAKRRDLDASRR